MCSNWNSCANLANGSDEYCGPLSLITISGTPCLAKILLVWRMTSSAVVRLSLAISMNLEK